MTIEEKTPRWLGVAFLIQAIASAVSYLILRDPLIVPGDIVGTMSSISGSALVMRASIIVEMITAMGIVMLGGLMFLTLKKQSINIALVAFGLYLLEVALLASSSLEASSLLRISQMSVAEGHPAYLQTLGILAYDSMGSANSLHMMPFAVGATLFYYLFFKSRVLPRALAGFGLVAASIAVVATLLVLSGVDIPLFVFMPNLPFELGAGLWLTIKGSSAASNTESSESNQEVMR